ncbi:MAG: LLM class F420-dependent oxidoreductase [Nocardioides sp.]
MLLSMSLAYEGLPRRSADELPALERAGLDMVWVAEAYGFDSPTLMGYIAAKTERLRIGAAILNVFSRTPGALLQTVAGLDHVSGGRAVIGLGASGPQVIEGFHGVPFERPVGRTREVADLIRRGLRREELTSDGAFHLPLPADRGLGLGKPLKLLNRPERAQVPIYVAALSPASVESAAEYADGWLPFLFHPERASGVWGDALRRAASRRDTALGPLQVAAGGMVAIGDGIEERVLDLVRPTYALYVGGMGAPGKNFYNDLATAYGYGDAARAIQDLYLAGRQREAAAKVPADWLRAGNLVGPATYVRERIAAFAEAGVTNLQVTLAPREAGGDPERTIAQLKEWMS